MKDTVLILGASGRFGSHAAVAFARAGWQVRRFRRGVDDLMRASEGAAVIVNALNPPYPDWAAQVETQHAEVRNAARAAGATVIVPGNVYVFGAGTSLPWSESSPHMAQNPLGQIRVRMEQGYKNDSIRTIILRGGDYLDTKPSGNWFDKIMIQKLKRDILVYPGRPDIPHAWAFLPDIVRAAVALADDRDALPRFLDVPFAGYTLSGQDIAGHLTDLLRTDIRLRPFSWLPVQLARPFWPLAKHLLEMRYLWNTPHRLDSTLFDTLLPEFEATPVSVALAQAIGLRSDGDINPSDRMPGDVGRVLA